MVNIFKDIKLENFNSIETFFFDLKNLIIHLCPNVTRFFKNSFLWENQTHKKNNIERTRISRWLGRENLENVARTINCCGWPSSPRVSVGEDQFLKKFSTFKLQRCWRRGGGVGNQFNMVDLSKMMKLNEIYIQDIWLGVKLPSC